MMKEIILTKQLSLKTNFSWGFIGNSLYAACQFGILIILAKLGSPEIVGSFALAFAVTAPIFMFTNLNLRGILATDVIETYHFKQYLSVRIMFTVLSLIGLCIFLFFSNYSMSISIIVLLVTISKSIESISDIIFGLFQKNERLDYVGKSLILKGMTLLLVILLCMFLYKSLTISLIAYVLVFFLVFYFMDIRFFKQFKLSKQNFSTKDILSITKLSVPLGFVLMLTSLNSNIPRYFIEQSYSHEMLGYFAAISNIMVAGTTVVSSLGQSITPRLARAFLDGNKKHLTKMIGGMGVLTFILGSIFLLVSIILGKQVLTLLYTTEYAQYQSALILISINSYLVFGCSFLGYTLTAARRFKVQPIILVITTALNAFLCYLLVPKYGVNGSIYAMNISSSLQLIMMFILVIISLNKFESKEKLRRAAL